MRRHRNEYYDSNNTVLFLSDCYRCKCEYEYTILHYLAIGNIVYPRKFFHVYKMKGQLMDIYNMIPDENVFSITLWVLDAFQQKELVEKNPIKPTYFRITDKGKLAWNRLRHTEQVDSCIFPYRG